ncbi:25738_t:CDS:2, partial [Gigaspora margarita]
MWMLYKKNNENRDRLVMKIEEILSNEWPGHEINVHLFGSSVNLLGTSTSDVDLCVTTPNRKLENIFALSVKLQKCAQNVNRKNKDIDLLKVGYKNNESIGRCLNKSEKNWMHWKLCIEEPFNIGRNFGNGVSYDSFKKIKKEFSRAARILYKADLKVCCQALIPLAEIYYKHEYNDDRTNIITNIITTPLDEIYEYEYNDDGSLVITLEALRKLQFQKANDALVRSLRYIFENCRDKKKVEKAKSILNIK